MILSKFFNSTLFIALGFAGCNQVCAMEQEEFNLNEVLGEVLGDLEQGETAKAPLRDEPKNAYPLNEALQGLKKDTAEIERLALEAELDNLSGSAARFDRLAEHAAKKLLGENTQQSAHEASPAEGESGSPDRTLDEQAEIAEQAVQAALDAVAKEQRTEDMVSDFEQPSDDEDVLNDESSDDEDKFDDGADQRNFASNDVSELDIQAWPALSKKLTPDTSASKPMNYLNAAKSVESGVGVRSSTQPPATASKESKPKEKTVIDTVQNKAQASAPKVNRNALRRARRKAAKSSVALTATNQEIEAVKKLDQKSIETILLALANIQAEQDEQKRQEVLRTVLLLASAKKQKIARDIMQAWAPETRRLAMDNLRDMVEQGNRLESNTPGQRQLEWSFVNEDEAEEEGTTLKQEDQVDADPRALYYITLRGAEMTAEERRQALQEILSEIDREQARIGDASGRLQAMINAKDLSSTELARIIDKAGSLEAAVKLVLPNKQKLDPDHAVLFAYVTTGYIEGIKKLLLHKKFHSMVPRNKLGDTLLHAALRVSYPDTEIITYLLGVGIDVNAPNKGGETALHIALNKYKANNLRSSWREIIKILLEHGAINHLEEGEASKLFEDVGLQDLLADYRASRAQTARRKVNAAQPAPQQGPAQKAVATDNHAEDASFISTLLYNSMMQQQQSRTQPSRTQEEQDIDELYQLLTGLAEGGLHDVNLDELARNNGEILLYALGRIHEDIETLLAEIWSSLLLSDQDRDAMLSKIKLLDYIVTTGINAYTRTHTVEKIKKQPLALSSESGDDGSGVFPPSGNANDRFIAMMEANNPTDNRRVSFDDDLSSDGEVGSDDEYEFYEERPVNNPVSVVAAPAKSWWNSMTAGLVALGFLGGSYAAVSQSIPVCPFTNKLASCIKWEFLEQFKNKQYESAYTLLRNNRAVMKGIWMPEEKKAFETLVHKAIDGLVQQYADQQDTYTLPWNRVNSDDMWYVTSIWHIIKSDCTAYFPEDIEKTLAAIADGNIDQIDIREQDWTPADKAALCAALSALKKKSNNKYETGKVDRLNGELACPRA